MNKLFIHDPVFRIMSPLFGGSLVYLLILLVNNDVGQLDEQFLGQELYLCIALSYLIQEFLRYFLARFRRRKYEHSVGWTILSQAILSILFTSLIVSLVIYFYYKQYLGFTASFSELMLFNSIFSLIAVSYVSLYISHHFLYEINTGKISAELEKKQITEENYRQFVRGINPDLLFEGLEALIVQMRSAGPEDPDELLDALSMVYRYILTHKENEPVAIVKETEALKDLVLLFGYLPYTRIRLHVDTAGQGLVIPGTLLLIVQELMRITIPSGSEAHEVKISSEGQYIKSEMKKNDRLNRYFSTELVETINRNYSLYSEQKVQVEESEKVRVVLVPKLELKNEER